MTFPIALAASFLALRAFSVSRIPDPAYDVIFASHRAGASVGTIVVENERAHIKIDPFRITEEESWPRLFRYHAGSGTVDEVMYAHPDVSFQKVRDYSRSTADNTVISVQIDPNNLPTPENARKALEISSDAGLAPKSASFAIEELANAHLEGGGATPDGYRLDPYVNRSAPNFFYQTRAYDGLSAYGPALVNEAKTIPIPVSVDYNQSFYAVGWIKP
ncbi:MAG: hypothetical protein ABW189_07220 [Rickettsiales bacterium]